jgi:hypothetical protein
MPTWASFSQGDNPMELRQNKIRNLRQYLRGWARNLCDQYKIERDRLSTIIDILERKAELVPLSDDERTTLRNANDDLLKLHRTEESKWSQRAKVKHIQKGGDNTKCFHLIANSKHRRKRIFQLEKDEGTIMGQENLKQYITEYYKTLFRPTKACDMYID